MPKVLIIYSSLIYIFHQSLAGFVNLVVLICAVLIEKNENWRFIWIPLCLQSFIFLLFQYIFQLETINNAFYLSEKSWIGFYESNDKNYWLYLFLYISIEMLCFCMRKNQKWREELPQHVLKGFFNDYDRLKDNYQKKAALIEAEEQHAARASAAKNNAEPQKPRQITIPDTEIAVSSRIQSQKTYRINADYQKFLHLHPFQVALHKIENLRIFYLSFAYELNLFMIILAVYFSMNFLTIVEIVLVSLLGWFSFVLNSDEGFSPKKVALLHACWSMFYYFKALDIIRKYVVFNWFPY